MTIRAEVNELPRRLPELVKQVQDGNEVLLTRGNKLVARLVPAVEGGAAAGAALRIRSFKGHRVLASAISQAQLAEEMFARQ
jgi:antitoxin (DNA-binding transcriptional repressor) of toxin-antitoxin stability system